MRLPQWLDDYIFNELGAKYQPSYSDMTNIHDDKEKTLNYLGTYFPRSYVEAYCIFSDFFENHKSEWENRKHISIFDFGCGTGGEIIGLLTVLNERFPKLEKVRVVGLDGNQEALLVFESILDEYKNNHCSFEIEFSPAKLVIKQDFNLSMLDSVMDEQFDFIISFKAICEFVTEKHFDSLNPYERIVNFMLPKLNDDGIIIIEDVTTKNAVSSEWLPKIMDIGINKCSCSIVDENDGYNQTYTITHSHKISDHSKVAWRIIK